jgi:anti-anti-sigma regulatory factor
LARVDGEALAILADLSRELRRHGREIWLAGIQPTVWLALQIARLDQLFTIRASRAQALTS